MTKPVMFRDGLSPWARKTVTLEEVQKKDKLIAVLSERVHDLEKRLKYSQEKRRKQWHRAEMWKARAVRRGHW